LQDRATQHQDMLVPMPSQRSQRFASWQETAMKDWQIQ
jgi:hypothetical protein